MNYRYIVLWEDENGIRRAEGFRNWSDAEALARLMPKAGIITPRCHEEKLYREGTLVGTVCDNP